MPASLKGGEYVAKGQMLTQRVEGEDRHASTRSSGDLGSEVRIKHDAELVQN